LHKVTVKINECENIIEKLENELAALMYQIDSDAVQKENSGENPLFFKYAGLKKKLDARINEWEELNGELVELKKNRYFRDL